MVHYFRLKLVLILLLLSIATNAQNLNTVLSMHQDKQLHISYTYIISSATTSYVLKRTKNKKRAIIIGIGTGVIIGIGKEVYDAKTSKAERGDIIADIVGATLGSFVVTIPF
jgi:uncharacterized protein YfiM (DUF2279 family)